MAVYSGIQAQNDTIEEAPLMLQEMVEQLKADSSARDPNNLEIDGLVVDETLTKVGRDFYEIFYNRWQAPPQAKNYTIFIREKPVPGFGTLISIKVVDDEIFSQRVPPRFEIVEEYAQYATYLTQNFLLDQARMKDQLESQDQSGSGIF
ncbi:MAG: CsgE family curli-type amyloid fiber assembly protein [Candidatus Cyclobacteriaceae bacterium M3_2C_046]